MKTKHVESLEDLVFRDKNKLYGAYFLRMRYHRYITLSLIFATFLFLSAFTYPFIKSYHVRGMVPGKTTIDTVQIITNPPIDEPPKAPLPEPPEPPVKIKFRVPVIVDSENEDTDFGKQDSYEDIKPLPPVIADNNPVPDEKMKEKTIKVEENEEPTLWVPEMPVFKGGESELYKYLSHNIKYPLGAKEANIVGTVYLTFVVEKDGSITNVGILRGIGGGCDEEAIRVVESMPPWNPGKNNGIPVRVKFTLPVKFIIE